MTPSLLHQLITRSALRSPDAIALKSNLRTVTYAQLAEEVGRFANGILAAGIGRGERVGIYLDKRLETVVASFGAPAAGAVFVPVNPLLKAEQVAYILRDCNVRILVTSAERLSLLESALAVCPDLRQVILVGAARERSCTLRYPDPRMGRGTSRSTTSWFPGDRPGHGRDLLYLRQYG